MRTIQIDGRPLESRAGHSSKGNQLKWKQEEIWYKADQMGYEGLVEVTVSQLLQFSSLTTALLYEPACIRYRDRELTGCASRNFLAPGEELVTLEKLYRQFTGLSLAGMLGRIADVKSRIEFTVRQTETLTGIADFGSYLTGMLEMDAFFLNEDRHTNNIAVLYDNRKNKFRLCPYFDMGLSLLSDTRTDFPLFKDMEECIGALRAKPFSRDFDDQMDAAVGLYGSWLKFDLTGREMAAEFERMERLWEDRYDQPIVNRVKELLCRQARKYAYMMRQR